MKISYDYVKTFIVFAESKNIYEAAQVLGITQPAVSNHLKCIEDYLGYSPFTLRGKKKVLNTLGKEIHRELSEAFFGLDYSLDMAKKRGLSPEQMTIRVGGRQEVLNRLPSFVIFPGKMHYYSMDGGEVETAISQNTIDFGISPIRPDSLEIISKSIISIGINFLVHKKHFLKKNPSLEALMEKSFVKDIPFYSYADDLPHMSEWCEKNDISVEDLNVRSVISDWRTIIDMVEKGEGYTLCPENYTPESDELVKISVPHKLVKPLRLYLLYSKDTKKLYPLDKCFSF